MGATERRNTHGSAEGSEAAVTARILIAALSLLIVGCAEKVRIHFSQPDISKITFNTDHCFQQSNGDLICKDVVVRLNRIRVQ